MPFLTATDAPTRDPDRTSTVPDGETVRDIAPRPCAATPTRRAAPSGSVAAVRSVVRVRSAAPARFAAMALTALLGWLPAPATAQATAGQVAARAAQARSTAQEAPRQLTADDYRRAERFLDEHTAPLVHGGTVEPRWMPDGSFWYENRIAGGREFLVVDPAAREQGRAFDHQRMSEAMASVLNTAVDPLDLPIADMAIAGHDLIVDVDRGGTLLRCDLQEYACDAVHSRRAPLTSGEVPSPDGRLAVFIRDHDLWVRDRDTGEETRLTTDGVEDFGYGTNNAGWVRRDYPVVKWSPDSRKIATFQHDARGVGMMYLTRTNVGHPDLDAWRYPLPEDSVIFRIHRVVIDLDRPDGDKVVRLAMEPDQHRSTCSDHVECDGRMGDVEWSDDGSKLAFVSSSRDHKVARVRIADASTGEVRDVFREVEETFYESWSGWRYLAGSNEILWFSQRDGWGHLFLYDAETGEVKRKVTDGPWNVLDIRSVDEEERTVTFVGNEREPGDPYFEYLYRVGLDDGEVTLLTPDSANHEVTLSPDGAHIVDSYSTPVTPPVSVLRDRDGEVVMTLQEADITQLVASGWQPPLPFTVKARDGETDLYGLLFRPTEFDPARKYPVVNYLYPGPQTGSVGSRSFRSSHRDHQSIAELGFVVIELDAMGTPKRSKEFHEAYYGDMGDNGLPDQIAGIEQLAERHPWIDIERVGIWGHSGGGFASTAGILRYPDFYDVAVSQAGNHDNRNYEDDWGEKWQGLLEVYPDGSTSYDNQANQLVAENLQGKLLLAHGTMDTNVPPSNTLLVVDALIEANKDFDLLMLPNRGHGFRNEPYMMRRRWDYFVRHLLGAEPPPEYRIGELERPIG